MIVIGVILFLLRRIRIKGKVLRKQKEILEQTNKNLDAMNQENSFLLKEVNHRVKNNLAFITDLIVHHRDLEEDVKSKMKLQDLSGRINALVFAQKDLLPFKKEQEGNGQSLRFFAFDLMESLININTQAIVLDVDIADVVLNIDTLVPLGLILNELPSNSSKHAVLESKTSLKIDVQIKIQREKILITYKDNGLNKLNKKKQQNSGMGMFILEGMVQQLKGSLNVESFQYQICLKIKK
jgi:two-component sensor histidine kinase